MENGGAVYKRSILPDLHMHRQFRIMNIHLAVGKGVRQFPAHILTQLDGAHGEVLVSPLAFNLEAGGAVKFLCQILLGKGHDGVLIFFACRGTGHGLDAEDRLKGFEHLIHIRLVVRRLHIDDGLPCVHLALPDGFQAVSDIL